jgi:hypothetical protein
MLPVTVTELVEIGPLMVMALRAEGARPASKRKRPALRRYLFTRYLFVWLI